VLLPFEAVYAVTSQLNQYLVGFFHIVYEWALSLFTSKLRRYKNRKEETEVKIVFLLTWVHEWWNSNLAKDISRQRQDFETRLLCN